MYSCTDVLYICTVIQLYRYAVWLYMAYGYNDASVTRMDTGLRASCAQSGNAVCSMQAEEDSVQWAVNSVQCAAFSVQRAVCSVHV